MIVVIGSEVLFSVHLDSTGIFQSFGSFLTHTHSEPTLEILLSDSHTNSFKETFLNERSQVFCSAVNILLFLFSTYLRAPPYFPEKHALFFLNIFTPLPLQIYFQNC